MSVRRANSAPRSVASGMVRRRPETASAFQSSEDSSRDVRVRVDETREYRRVAEIDHLRAGRNRQPRAGGCNPPALHENDGVGNRHVGLSIEQSRRLDRDRGRRLLRTDAQHCDHRQSDRQQRESFQHAGIICSATRFPPA
jgi:hypothetical protein